MVGLTDRRLFFTTDCTQFDRNHEPQRSHKDPTMNGTPYHVHQARMGHVVAARRRLASAPAMPMATWHKTTVSGHIGAMSIFLFGIDDATARQPTEASP